MIKNILTLTANSPTQTYQEQFDTLANEVLNKFILHAGNAKFQIAEIEFYLKDGVHKDPFTHCDTHQSTIGKWYFHRQRGRAYKNGTYMGLDITFGTPDSFGGILIRSLYDIENKTIIEGPCNCVKAILKNVEHESIDSFVGDNQLLDVVDNQLLHLEYNATNTVVDGLTTVFKGPRVGLTLKRYTKSREGYLMNDYRYINRMLSVKKFKSGMVLSMHRDGMSNDEIKKATKTSIRNIDKYIALYNAGKEIDPIQYNGKKLKVGDLCMLYGACERIDL